MKRKIKFTATEWTKESSFEWICYAQRLDQLFKQDNYVCAYCTAHNLSNKKVMNEGQFFIPLSALFQTKSWNIYKNETNLMK